MRACHTQASHIRARNGGLTLTNRSRNRQQDCHTRLSHKRSVRGLWLRGSIYQFRVRVPVDLRAAIGCLDLNRSLRTDSPTLAARLARIVASEIERMFEQKRREIGLAYEGRLIGQDSMGATVGATIASRSGIAPASIPTAQPVTVATTDEAVLTLSDVYSRYVKDPTKRRSDRTMLAHDTTRRVVEDSLSC